jgi:TatD DNase family protein
VIENALVSGISEIVNVGYDLESSRQAIKLAEEYNFMYAAVGVHPHDASTLSKSAIRQIEEMAEHERVVAVGEMGLDYYRDLSPRDVQKKAFIEQLEVARSVKLPVIIHVREAYSDAMGILKEWGRGDGVMHCFSGSVEQAESFLKLGFKLGFGGSLTFGSARLESIAKLAPRQDILIETDCPYLAPRPRKGRNEPANLRIICEKLAAVLGISLDDAAAVSRRNARTFFRLFEA